MDKIGLSLAASIVYMVAVASIGFAVAKRSKSFEDYAVAGRRLGGVMVYATILATWFGTGLALGGASMAYSYGFSGVIMDPIGAGLSIMLFGLFFAKLLRRKGYITISDFFRERYGGKMEGLSAIVQILAYIGWSASLLVTFGTIMKVFTGMSYEQGLALGVLVTLAYTMVGGLWSVVCTDFIQALLLIAGVITLLFEAIDEIGGLQAVRSTINPSMLSILPERNFGYLGYFGLLGAAFYVSSWLVQGIGAINSQDLVQRATAARSGNTARNAAVAASISYIILGLIPAFIGVLASSLYPGLDNPDEVLPRLAINLLPTIPFVVFSIGLLAALMSSADSAILIPSVMVAENIVPRLGYRSDKAKLGIARLMVPIVTFTALFIALKTPTIYMLMNLSWELILMTHAAPFIAGIVSGKPSERLVLAAVLAGLVL
ncbi:MAG: sodium:solute symporter family protein [Desulfurococcales archaeon]|nr:sodium:solute symporter family protein [Desulfurococcales archaeon]